MPRPLRIHVPGAYYHLLARGNAGQDLFREESDYLFFLDDLEKLRHLYAFEAHSFCLMPNHAHLFLRAGVVPWAAVMRRLLGRFAMRFNAALQEHGHVFQDRYKSLLCLDDSYFLSIVRYIHQNPVKAGLVPDPSAWPWSSMQAYLGRDCRVRVSQSKSLAYFPGPPQEARGEFLKYNACSAEVPGWLDLSLEAGTPPMRGTPFVDGEEPDPCVETSRPTLERCLTVAATAASVDPGVIRGRSIARAAVAARRAMMLQAIEAGWSGSEIARFLGVSEASVSRAIRNLEAPFCAQSLLNLQDS